MVRSINEILQDIMLLASEDREQLFTHYNQQNKTVKEPESSLLEIRRKVQEKKKFVCPHCNCSDIIGHGNYRGRKRYKCKTCKKIFNDLTGTSVSKIHKKKEWQKYMSCISEGMTLRESAKQCNISYQTSFIWRHKILSSLYDIGCAKMEGIIEGDETFFLYSEKGKRNIIGRKPRKRGSKASRAGINDEHIAVIVSTDRHGDFVANVSGRGRVSAKSIDKCIGKWIGNKAEVLCTDSHRSYGSFAKKKGLQHIPINFSKGQHVKDKIYHIQNINSIHSNLKDWMRKFKGGGRL